MKLPIFKTIAEKQQAYNYKRVYSLAEAHYILDSLYYELPEGCKAYFRGQAEGSWKIYASAQREWLLKELAYSHDSYSDFLGSLLHAFKSCGSEYLKKYCNVVADFSIFSTSQYYGAPTPFVDWTSNYDVALYFASLGNENCVGFETDSYFSVYYLTVGKGAEPPNNDLLKFSTVQESHKNEMKKVSPKWKKILGPDNQEALDFEVWGKYPVICMEESDDKWMQIANPRPDLQGGAFVYNNSPEKSLDQIFAEQKMIDKETGTFLSPQIHCLDIHKSALPELQSYLKDKNINSGFHGLCSNNWGANLYRQFLANDCYIF